MIENKNKNFASIPTRGISVSENKVPNGEYTDHWGLNTKNFLISILTKKIVKFDLNMFYFELIFELLSDEVIR